MDFLTFKSFISTSALIVFYYIGAFILPIGTWFLSAWLIKKYKFIDDAQKIGRDAIWGLLNKKQQTKLVTLFIIFFLFLELFWRMMFEFLIAYMQIRDALLQSQAF
ncbi:MAG: DUF4282 domain-containing protein [gamma proteobacterium endosymbiont of Lamellibrachia anaximandri]|nr:DUF4282 domain-containing protein [gamma proteobacterium endosymbiont of Lamellibrachia anaximandri]MBL3534286.1 DUF4282 domain-containing protein [gamma proteobacterium endosymbiont of Lamellibrachia anaximandri]